MNSVNCKNCANWFQPAENSEIGLCRLNPPETTIIMTQGMDNRPNPVNLSHWPETRATDFCGQHDYRPVSDLIS